MAPRRQEHGRSTVVQDKRFFVSFGVVQVLIGVVSLAGLIAYFLREELTQNVQFCGYSGVAIMFCGILSLLAGFCHSLRFLIACIFAQALVIIAAIVGISTTVTALKYRSLRPADYFAFVVLGLQVLSPVIFAFFLIFPLHRLRSQTQRPTRTNRRPHHAQLIDSTSV